jgi:hypothetical protein
MMRRLISRRMLSAKESRWHTKLNWHEPQMLDTGYLTLSYPILFSQTSVSCIRDSNATSRYYTT